MNLEGVQRDYSQRRALERLAVSTFSEHPRANPEEVVA